MLALLHQGRRGEPSCGTARCVCPEKYPLQTDRPFAVPGHLRPSIQSIQTFYQSILPDKTRRCSARVTQLRCLPACLSRNSPHIFFLFFFYLHDERGKSIDPILVLVWFGLALDLTSAVMWLWSRLPPLCLLPRDGLPARGRLSNDDRVEALLQGLLNFGPAAWLLLAAPVRIAQLRRAKLVVLPNRRGFVKSVCLFLTYLT